jgi:anti-sigma factor RsiW
VPVDSSLSERGPHDEAEELLPWYATGQLEPDDRARVERHLYACAVCREQLMVERRLIGEFQATSPQMESGWARLRARIEPPRPATPPRPSMLAELWSILSRPAVATLAVAQLAFVVVAGSALLSLSRPDYHALGSAPEPAAANAIVMFRAAATQRHVSQALNAAGASIVGGPTATGAYLVHLDPAKRQSALAQLQANGDVELAQPVDGNGP